MRAEAVAITGIGVVSAGGKDFAAFREALQKNKSCLGPLRDEVARGLPMREGGTASFESPDRALDGILRASKEALETAQILQKTEGEPSKRRIGVVLGTALGSIERGEAWLAGASVDVLRSLPLHALADEIAKRHALEGPRATFSVTCLSSLHALERAIAVLSGEKADAMLVCGVDALTRFMQAGFCSLDVLSSSGLVLGEAACAVVVEPLEKARARGAKILGVVTGLGMRSDSTHLTSPDESGEGMARAIAEALESAGRTSSEVSAVSVTARAAAVYERMYARVLPRVFGEKLPRVSTWEGVCGHVLAASGAVGLAHACLELEREDARSVLALSVGFGGQSGAVLVEKASPLLQKSKASEESAPRVRGATIVGRGVSVRAAEDLETLFPGRFSAAKRFPDEVRALVAAVAKATESAGWWKPRSGASIDGGLVVGVDLHAFAPALRFGQTLAEKQAPGDRRPSDFLFALPSSAAALLGVLFGLQERQATIAEGGLSAHTAIAHAIDLLEARAVGRVVVAAQTFVGGELLPALSALGLVPGNEQYELAVAWCLDRDAKPNRSRIVACEIGDPDPPPNVRLARDTAYLMDLPALVRGLAATPLLAVERLLEHADASGEPLVVFHGDACRGLRRHVEIEV